MFVRKLENKDTEKVEQFLSQYAETSMFLRSNMKRAGLTYEGKDYQGDYFGAFDEDNAVTGVLSHYWSNGVMMQAPDTSILDALLETFMKAVTRPVQAVLGENHQAEHVIEALGLSGHTFATNSAERLYTLDLNNLQLPEKFDFSKAEMIDASTVDKDILARWFKAYEIEALGSADNEALDLRVKDRVERTSKGWDCWALVVDGEPVCLSGFNARLPDIVQIGPVWTPPENRGEGLARAIVALTLKQARDEGVEKAVLFTDNPAAARAYEAIGFEETGKFRLSLLKEPVDLRERLQL